MAEYHDRRHKMQGAQAHWESGHPDWDGGVILLPEGVVEAMMQGCDEHVHLTRLDAVIDGKHVIRTWMRRYSRRGVIKLARELLREHTDE